MFCIVLCLNAKEKSGENVSTYLLANDAKIDNIFKIYYNLILCEPQFYFGEISELHDFVEISLVTETEK